MATYQDTAQLQHRVRADVCVIGSGIVGLINSIALAKRGLHVVCIDQPTDKQLSSYKVGESLLIFSNAFLRTLGELDDHFNESFEKEGFWMAHGLEGRTDFDETVSEWGFESHIPQSWIDKFENPVFPRALFRDAQIVRPEVEAELRERARKMAGIDLLDRGLVRDIELAEGGGDHLLRWSSRDKREQGEIAARWVVDCSGRHRLLARRFGHDLPLQDDFRTTAAWAQFSGCTDEIFDERWNYRFPDGVVARRDHNTVHLWGDGYWIWLIRLAGDRISVGVTYHRGRPPEEGNAREVFWKVLRRYPLLEWLTEDNVLEFSAYRDVQHLTDTFVSPRRYAMVGDASSIIDAYYSQGISLSMTTSWHIANIAEQDVKQGVLDIPYLEHVNRAATADWRIMRSMVQSKYSPAIADSRFFILDHMLDYLVFGATLLGRFRAVRWLLETDGGYSARETPEQERLRTGLTRRLYLSQSAPWHRVDPQRVAGLIEGWHRGLERRAMWRLENGVQLPPTKAAMRAYSALPALWKLPRVQRMDKADLSLAATKEPEFVTATGKEYRPPVMAVNGTILLTLTSLSTLFDIVDTGVRKARAKGRELRRHRRRVFTLTDPTR
ncbi:NAD(P)/FAD-dependent oxidoreductase [Streptomyces coeruleorubidus]|uniref:NAD(P)/FAD-dependent oxidoreductase n=1 Tax=Streptomyces coeruleorubidus TaxID=116188 RepID=UPI00378ADFD0